MKFKALFTFSYVYARLLYFLFKDPSDIYFGIWKIKKVSLFLRFSKIGQSRFIFQVHECPWANPTDD